MNEKDNPKNPPSTPNETVEGEWDSAAKGATSPVVSQPEDNALPAEFQNFKVEVFDERQKFFDATVPGHNRVFSFVGNVELRGDIPSNATITIFDGAAVVRPRSVGSNVTIITRSSTEKESEEHKERWREYVRSLGAGKRNLLEPVSGLTFTYLIENEGTEEQQETSGPKPIQITPLDIYIESSEWSNRADIETAFDGDIIGHGLHLISAGSVFFNGHAPPHTYIYTVHDCYIGGTSGALSLLNIGGEGGLHAYALGSINTASVYGNVDVGAVFEDCTISCNRNVTIHAQFGQRSVANATGDITLSAQFLEGLSQDEKEHILSRTLTTNGKVLTTEGKLLSGGDAPKQIGYDVPSDAGMPKKPKGLTKGPAKDPKSILE